MDSNQQEPFEFYSTSGYKLSTDPFVWVFETRDPTPQDVNYPQQKQWLNVTLQKVWILTSFSSITGQVLAVWTEVSSSVADLNSLTGDDAVAVNPVNNNINLVGGTNGAFETATGGSGVLEGLVKYDNTTIGLNLNNQLTVLSPLLSANFSAFLTADALNATGAGGLYTLANLTELYDIGNDFDPVTGIFTVPTSGYYVFFVGMSLANLNVNNDSANIRLRNLAGGQDIVQMSFGNPFAMAGVNSGQYICNASKTEYLLAGQTIQMLCTVFNGISNTTTVKAGRNLTYFAGYFLGA